jgi:hypothetical protein
VPGLGARAALEQQRGRGLPDVLVVVVAGGARDLPFWLLQPGDDRGSTSASSGETTRSRSASVLEGAICSSGTSSPVDGSRYCTRLW